MKLKNCLSLFIGLTTCLYVHAQFPIVLEAENAKLFGSLNIASVAGFSGGKYVNNFLINTDSYLVFDNVDIPQAGAYELKVFSTGSARPFSIKVNQYERSLMRTTDSPDWNAPPTSVSSTYIYLDKGVNVIKIAAEIENGPNIDKFEIHRTSITIERPLKEKSVFPYDFTDEADISAQYENNTLFYLTDNDETTYYEIPGVSSATITVDCKENKLITSMLLAGEKGVDVSSWQVDYSTDGIAWRSLTPASSKTVGMGDLTLFTYNRNASSSRYAARYYRLTATGTNGIKIAEWQLFGAPFESNNQPFPTDITSGSTPQNQATGDPKGKASENFLNLFDRKMTTKYNADGSRFYVQYVLDKACKFNSYSLTSANDAPEKDPKLWSFSGYNPEEGWIELDEQLNFNFPGRYTTMKFNIHSDKEFTAFILEVSGVKSGNSVHLSNLQVFGEATGNPSVSPALPGESGGNPEERAAELVKLMTKSEKLSYISGTDWMYTKAIPRLGIPQLRMSDGPQGLGTWGKSTAYPCAIALASSWNENLAWSYGEALASDCHKKGVNILLGPGVNIYRAPMCGRNFEYMGEDPYLASRTAVNYIKGLQENHVMGVVKHFAVNFQEYDRNYTSSDVDERTLHEIYFPAFKAAIQEANVGSVMSSYNLLNGTWATHNPWLLTTVLREQWKFKGILMSDWGSTHACVPAVNAGLDLEMPSGERLSQDSLRYYINRSKIDISAIDKKVQHTLQTFIRFGFPDKKDTNPNIVDTEQTALNVARESMVLLKNENDILPLKTGAIKNIVVAGKHATRYNTGGGSGRVEPAHFVSFLDGIKTLAAKKGVNVKYVDEYDHMDDFVFTGSGSNENGFVGEYYNNTNLQGTPTGTRMDKIIDFDFQNGTNIDGIGTSNYSIRWTGELRPQESGEYTFTLGGDDGFHMYIDENKVIDDWNAGQERYKTYKQNLTAGKKYSIKVEYYQLGGAAMVDFYWTKTGDENYFLNAMNQSDVVIACFGHNSNTEAEAGDRTFELPAAQKKLVDKIIKTTTPIVGVVTAGGNVEMQSWEPKLKGLLWAWYPGQEGGTALAEILFGEKNPSGKLPVTFEKKWADNPVYKSYYDPDNDKHVIFTEGIFVGYRGYDKLNRTVQYPFGYGLSYTTFSASKLVISETTENNSLIKVSCELKNTGNVAGAQVLQLYAGKRGEMPVERPLNELKSFKKIYLEPGESKTVIMYLPKDAFSYYDVGETSFVVDEGTYEISVGFSSRDLPLKQEVIVKDNNTGINQVSYKQISLIPSIVNAGEIIRINTEMASDIKVYNVSGFLKSMYRNTNIIPTGNLSQGMYIVNIDLNNQKIDRKFIVR